MHKSLATAAVLGTVLLSSAALAATMSATGVIRKVDSKGDSITLKDGKVYMLSEKVEAETLKAGEKVTVTYEMKNHKMIAGSVKVMK